MKNIFAVFFAMILGVSISNAQSADERVGSLINSGDWFELEREYPVLRDSVQWKPLCHLADALIGYNFNNPDSVINNVDWIVANAQEKLGFNNVKNMVMLKGMTLGDMGDYAAAADYLNDYLNGVAGKVDVSIVSDIYTAYRMYNKVRNEAKPEIVRHGEGDVVVPLEVENIELVNGEKLDEKMMNIPVRVNNKEYKFIFDTGASHSYVSERFAKDVGLRVVDSTYVFGGMRISVGGRGTTDSIMIGNIAFKHPMFIIGKANEEVDSIFRFDAVLGQDFLLRVGEARIYPSEGKIVFPSVQSGLPSYAPNMMIDSNQLYVEGYNNDEKLLLHFDTGGSKSELHSAYYAKHKEDVERDGVLEVSGRGGEGGIMRVEAYQLKHFNVRVGDCETELKDIDVLTDKYHTMQNKEDGSLGMDFITACKEVIINTNKMFVKVRK